MKDRQALPGRARHSVRAFWRCVASRATHHVRGGQGTARPTGFMVPMHAKNRKRALQNAQQGRLGLLLLAVCWPLNWALPGMRTAYLFFPLWLGYILVMDALVLARAGTSLWTRSRRDFVLLFVASAPAWWLFELVNQRTGNWEYLGANTFTPLEYYALCTLSFSTVMPAVFETAEFVRTFGCLQRFASRRPVNPTRRLALVLLLAGLTMLSLTLLWPKIFYPLVWISLALIFEPLNRWLGRRICSPGCNAATGGPSCRCRSARSCADSSGRCGITGRGPNGFTTRPGPGISTFSKCRCWATAVTCPLRWNCSAC